MPIDRASLFSVAYWRPDRQPQRFYIAFCLLVSSIQDSLLGFKERSSQNLNWATTCSYYSLVHAGRLLTFLALGDFPTSHASLRNLMSSSTDTASRRAYRTPDGYPFDWLREFSGPAGRNLERPAAATPPAGFPDLRDSIVQYLTQIGVDQAVVRLDEFGRILSAAGPLRSDSNYEALLIAHEYEHTVVSSAFESLAKYMGNAAESELPFVVDTFNSFVQSDPDLATDRAAYYGFLRKYLNHRLIPSVRRKLHGFPDIEAKLTEITSRIHTPAGEARYDHLEHMVSMDIFSDKARLMTRFQNRIKQLRQAHCR